MGLEPTVYPVTGDRFSQLNYGRIFMNFSNMCFFLARKSSHGLLYIILNNFKALRMLYHVYTAIPTVSAPSGFKIESQSGTLNKHSTTKEICTHSMCILFINYIDIVSVNGIGPLFKAYESFVLPLNYTDMCLQNITKNGVLRQFLY